MAHIKLHLYLISLLLMVLHSINKVSCLEIVNNLQHFVSTEKIQAEDYTLAFDFKIQHNCSNEASGVFYVGGIKNDTLLEYDRVDFGSGVDRVALYASNTDYQALHTISFHVASSTSPAFALIPLKYTGLEACTFILVDVIFDAPLSGEQDLFIAFPTAYSYGDYLHLDWFVFNQSVEIFTATDTIQAEDFTAAQTAQQLNDCPDTSLYYVQLLSNISVLEFDLVDFGLGTESVTLRLSNPTAGAVVRVALHLGSSSNAPIANVKMGQTGSGSCDFSTITAFLEVVPTGTQKLFLTFSSSTEGNLGLDWFYFNRTLTSY